MKRLHLLLIPLFLISCAGSPTRISMMDQETLKTVDTLQLCAAYGCNHSEKIKAELERRNIFTEREWSLINSKKISIGISISALYASWGPPTSKNESVGKWGVHIQHVYGLYSRYSKPTYVYTDNGKVSSWQK